MYLHCCDKDTRRLDLHEIISSMAEVSQHAVPLYRQAHNGLTARDLTASAAFSKAGSGQTRHVRRNDGVNVRALIALSFRHPHGSLPGLRGLSQSRRPSVTIKRPINVKARLRGGGGTLALERRCSVWSGRDESAVSDCRPAASRAVKGAAAANPRVLVPGGPPFFSGEGAPISAGRECFYEGFFRGPQAIPNRYHNDGKYERP